MRQTGQVYISISSILFDEKIGYSCMILPQKMAWDVAQLRHNASILYNHLCSDDARRVYVDAEGHLQLDSRPWWRRQVSSLGNSSRMATDRAAIRVLRRVLNALEEGVLPQDQVVMQERIPLMRGLWLNRETFGVNIGNSDRFKTWRNLDDNQPNRQLSWAELVEKKVNVLTAQIIHGKQRYQENKYVFNFYDFSDEEDG